MLIIEGLQAAWGTVQRVLEAFERFFTFLKAVRTGRAGPQFANAVAAAAIAVIDFVANWLLKRLRKPAGKIAKKLKALAKKLGKKLAKVGKGCSRSARSRKLKGKPAKKKKPDKRAQAGSASGRGTEFIARQLDRGMRQPVLWVQMQYARARWRVRIRLRVRDDSGTLTVVRQPPRRSRRQSARSRRTTTAPAPRSSRGSCASTTTDTTSFTRALEAVVEAPVDLDWNDPSHFLDAALDPAPARAARCVEEGRREARRLREHRACKKKLYDTWNVVWRNWLRGKFASWNIKRPRADRDTRRRSGRTRS